MSAPLGWLGIVRLGLVQASIGAVVVLTTSMLNRVMTVELALPAVVPGLLVALHYAVQLLRPRWGHGADAAGRRTPWIVGGMGVLAMGGIGAATATAVIPAHPWLGLFGAVGAFACIGLGVGAAGTSLLALAATCVAPAKRPVAAPLMWIMMIAGFAVTAGTAGHFLMPFTFSRLMQVMSVACGLAVLLSVAALWRLEPLRDGPEARTRSVQGDSGFRMAVAQIWAEPVVRRFTLFVFVSMLAYSAQDLVLEPFAGAVLSLAPADTTQLSGIQHAGALLGMLGVASLGGLFRRGRSGLMGACAVGGCLLSAVVLSGLAGGALADVVNGPLRSAVFLLGFGNGVFAVAAVGTMMSLAGHGTAGHEGLRMGIWGAAQAAAFGLGSFVGPALVDLSRLILARPAQAYALVFCAEALLFVAAALLARGLLSPERRQATRLALIERTA